LNRVIVQIIAISVWGKAIQTSNLAGRPTFTRSIQKFTNFGEKKAWAYPGTDQIFGVPAHYEL